MIDIDHYAERETLLAHEIDDLLLRARGLVLVRDLLADRGASQAEVEAHNSELERVRALLADTIRGSNHEHIGEAA